jgi:hypothetical protein
MYSIVSKYPAAGGAVSLGVNIPQSCENQHVFLKFMGKFPLNNASVCPRSRRQGWPETPVVRFSAMLNRTAVGHKELRCSSLEYSKYKEKYHECDSHTALSKN